jgi:hypothetical protein
MGRIGISMPIPIMDARVEMHRMMNTRTVFMNILFI